MSRRLLLLAAVFLFALPHARADDATKRAKIEEMFTILKMDSLMQQMMTQGIAQGREVAKQMMGDKPLTPADQKIMDDYLTKLVDAVSDVFSWKKLEPAYVDLYASAYSEQQVDDILAFYKSPTGQTLLAKTPELVAKSGDIAKGHLQELAPRMQAITTDFEKQLRDAHPDKAPAK